MIKGEVHDSREAVVPVGVFDRRKGEFVSFKFVLDTGFTGDLCLSRQCIAELELNSVGMRGVTLADGHEKDVPAYDATVSLHGQSHDVIAFELGPGPLMGMSLIWETKVTLFARAGGDVLIEQLNFTWQHDDGVESEL